VQFKIGKVRMNVGASIPQSAHSGNTGAVARLTEIDSLRGLAALMVVATIPSSMTSCITSRALFRSTFPGDISGSISSLSSAAS
jgi:hypothetical protein